MLRSIKDIHGYVLIGEDEEIGQCRDFLFDERFWTVRYMVADTGKWLPGRKVLVSPISLAEPDWATKRIPARLTRSQIENCPPLEEHMPVSQEYEARFLEYYGFPYYWVGGGLWGPGSVPRELYGMDPAQAAKAREEARDMAPNPLRSTKEVTGYQIAAADDDIGHVEDFIVETDNWALRYVVVDTRNWLPGGRKVLVAPDWITGVDWREGHVAVDLTKEAVENSPEYDPSEPINREYEIRLYDFHGRPTYW